MGINETLTGHLRDVLFILQQEQIPYALAGGLAYSALVEPRATMDIDVLALLRETSLEVLFARLERHFETMIVHRQPMHFRHVTIWRAVGYTNSHEVIFDVLLAESPFHRKILERAVTLDFFDLRIKVVTIEDLLLLKRIANRPQDKADIAKIYTLYQDEIDQKYVTYWIKALEIETE